MCYFNFKIKSRSFRVCQDIFKDLFLAFPCSLLSSVTALLLLLAALFIVMILFMASGPPPFLYLLLRRLLCSTELWLGRNTGLSFGVFSSRKNVKPPFWWMLIRQIFSSASPFFVLVPLLLFFGSPFTALFYVYDIFAEDEFFCLISKLYAVFLVFHEASPKEVTIFIT